MAPELALRPRTAPEIVDAAFLLARRHYLPIVTVAALGAMLVAPSTLLRPAPTIYDYPSMPGGVYVGWLLTVYSMAVGTLARGAAVAIAVEAYLGRALTPSAALLLAARRAWPLLAAGAYYGLMLWFGAALLLVPAGFVIARYGVLAAVVVTEEPRGPVEALRRTAALTAGRRWRVFVTVGIAYLVLMLLGVAAQYAGMSLSGNIKVGTLVALGVGVALSPFYSAVIAALYVDLRIVHEGLDLEVLAAEIGATGGAAGPPPAVAAR
jgi:hypothetical protein